MIRHEVSFQVPRPVATVFAYLADVSRTPEWLGRCVGIAKDGEGPLVTGAKLHYSYREGDRVGVMEGEAALVEGDRQLRFKYWDRNFKVQIGFDFESSGGGTQVRHSIEIDPTAFMMKLLQPVIRAATVKQTAADMATLQAKLLAQG